MNNEKVNQIIDEVYENYLKHNDEVDNYWIKKNPEIESRWKPYSKEEFINKCKTDSEFSEKWGLKIEERELSWEEKVQWVMKNTDVEWENLYIVEEAQKLTTPTKLITITYNDTKTEVYE